MSTAGRIFPPDFGLAWAGELAAGVAAGGAGRAGTSAFMLTPGMADVVGRSPAPRVGASAISVGAAGRSLCDSDAAWNCLRGAEADGKSTRLNSSHLVISYAVFCLKKKHKRSRHT